MNASEYKIAVQRVRIDGDILFEATVTEFPDLVIYEDSADAAYCVALEAIEGLVEMAEDMGHPIPQPSTREYAEYSGKMTFRPGKRLHRDIAAAAAAEGLSQNQWLCNIVAQATTAETAQAHVSEAVAQIFSNVQASIGKWKTIEMRTVAFGQFTLDDPPSYDVGSFVTGAAMPVEPVAPLQNLIYARQNLEP